MAKRLPLAIWLLIALLPWASAAAGVLQGRVVSVSDGDTLTVLVDRRQIRVRLVDIGGVEVDVLSPFYYARPPTIYGGSSEIQRNILAKYVLRLPSQ